MYELSFLDDFFHEDMDGAYISDKPTSCYGALYNLWVLNRSYFSTIVKDCLKIKIKDQKYLGYDELIFSLIEKIKQYNTCRNLNTPVEVYINANHTIKVY